MNTDKIYAEQLANEYAPKDTSEVVALRKLDKKAKLPANIFTRWGILSALVFGIGMCLGMSYREAAQRLLSLQGIIIGIIGMIGMGVNLPIYKKLLEKGSRKYAFWEIIQLAKRDK